jgi:hypothetical protein
MSYEIEKREASKLTLAIASDMANAENKETEETKFQKLIVLSL